jgi:hypothetical protein
VTRFSFAPFECGRLILWGLRLFWLGAGSGLVSIALAALLARGDRHVVTRPSAFDVHPTYHILTTDLGM